MTNATQEQIEIILRTSSNEMIVDWFMNQSEEVQAEAFQDERVFLAFYRWLSPDLQKEFKAEIEKLAYSSTPCFSGKTLSQAQQI